jgi:glycosyltransferase involved in cell wall biosynthesis
MLVDNNLMIMNIFLIKTYGKASRYGIGSYIETIVGFLSKYTDINVFVVHINSNLHKGVKYLDNGKIRDIFITFETPGAGSFVMDEFCISELQAKALYSILYSFMRGADTNIIHLNSVLEIHLAEAAKEYDHCTLVYTMHVLLWQVFYKNNWRQFISELEDKLENNHTFSIETEKRLCMLADNIVCLTSEAMNFVGQYYGITPSKVRLIHNVIDNRNISILSHPQKEILRRKFGFSAEQVIVIFSGRLMYEKGLDFAAEALIRLQRRNYDFHFLICGDGNLAHYVDRCRAIIGKTSFSGFTRKEVLYEFYQIADVGILPSFIEQNSFSALEMMAHGLPVIACDTDAFSQFKHREESMIHIATTSAHGSGYMDVDLLENSLARVIEDAQYRRKIGENALKLVADSFSLHNLDVRSMYEPYVTKQIKTLS